MDQLPAKLLLGIFAAVHLIIPSDVLVQSAQHNHGHHTAQEENNYQRVENREPLDIRVRHGL